MSSTNVQTESIAIPANDILYRIHFRPLEETADIMAPLRQRVRRCVLITDDNVGPLYAERVVAALERREWTPKVITVPSGENSKSSKRLAALYDEILTWGIDRQVPVVALGGGVVGDLAGYAAATLLRGLPLVQVPTSLIAQVDSSIGGKTGINHVTGKNLIGAFHQPHAIVADPSTLASLPDREWFSGMAEVVKHALIADADFAEWLVAHADAISARDERSVSEMVRRAARIKVKVVQEDVFESGRRALLNFGHTFGHAIERTAGYGVFTHGEAVALGMRAAIHVSAHLRPSVDFSLARRLIDSIPVEGDRKLLSIPRLNHAMQFDKKVETGKLRFVVLRSTGDAEVVENVAGSIIDEAWLHAKSL